MNISQFDINKIIPYINNPRINTLTVDKVAASIKEFGFQQPIVVDGENVIVAGHTRYLAAQKLGLEKVPVQVANDLSSYQIKAYRIADNRIPLDSTWDDELLRIELGDLGENDFDLSLTGFDVDELDILLDTNNTSNQSTESVQLDSQYQVILDCDNENHQQQLYDEFKKRRIKCKVVSL